MRFAALRGRASFSIAPVVVTRHGSAASGTTVARTVRYNFSARPKQSKPGPRFEVEAGTRTSIITQPSTPPRKVLQDHHARFFNTDSIAHGRAATLTIEFANVPRIGVSRSASGAVSVWL